MHLLTLGALAARRAGRGGDRAVRRIACEAVDGWDSEDPKEIVVGDRRMRVGRRRAGRRPLAVAIAIVLAVAVVGLAVGGYFWFTRPTGLAAMPNPAVVAPGGFRATIGANNTITVGLEVRNTADNPLTLIEARIVAPAGLTSLQLAIIPTGDGNQGFALDGDLPPTAPVQLGTTAIDRNAIIAARFTVDCAGLLASGAATNEQIFVTVQVGDQQRVEELTPPAVGDLPWLTATAQRACLDPVSTESPEPQLPPLPDPTATSSTGATPG